MSTKRLRRERKSRKFILNELLNYDSEFKEKYLFIKTLDKATNQTIRKLYHVDIIRLLTQEFLEKNDNKLIFIALIKTRQLSLSKREQKDIKIIINNKDPRVKLYCDYFFTKHHI